MDYSPNEFPVKKTNIGYDELTTAIITIPKNNIPKIGTFLILNEAKVVSNQLVVELLDDENKFSASRNFNDFYTNSCNKYLNLFQEIWYKVNMNITRIGSL